MTAAGAPAPRPTTDWDVVCLGESMITFLPDRPGPLAEVPSFTRAIGGAESNVACALAAAGHRARWVSR
ncbi:PfkB family carbohydrate kinase, partial [Streptomyces sp. ZG43]